MDRRSESRLADSDFRNHWIAEAAYFHAKARNFAPGGALDDWLNAEHVFEHTMHRRHIRHKLDSELLQLHSLVVKIAELVLYQLQRVRQAFDERNIVQANLVIVGDQAIDGYEKKLDKQVAQILCLEHPVANDLRAVLSTAKIGYELERIGNELGEAAQAVVALFDAESHVSNPVMLDGAIMLCKQVEVWLGNLMDALKNGDLVDIEMLEQLLQDCQCIQHESISRLAQDTGLLPRTINLLCIIKSFEASAEHCLDVVKYLNHLNKMLY